jgi:LysM repeat protein
VIPSGLATSAPSGLFSAPPSVAPSIGPSVAPTEQASQGPVSSPRLYRIKTGDSLAKIANRFGITLQDILDANPDISNPNNIFVGQIIVVPVQVPQAT